MPSRKRKKRQLNNIKIQKIGYQGVGVAQLDDGKKVIVKGGALPGSVVDIKITRSRADSIVGHIINIQSQSKKYTDGKIFCPHFFEQKDQDITKIGCGGCKWQMMSYKNQLKLKQQIINENFEKLSKNQNIKIKKIVASKLEKNYRNKIEFSFGKYISHKDVDIEAHWQLGFHKQGEFSKIVDIDNCGLITQNANKIFEYMKNILKNCNLPVYDQYTHQGFFRHLVIRQGINTDEFLINLVVNDKYLENSPSKSKFEEVLANIKNDEFIKNNINSFLVTYNSGLADVVRGNEISTKNIIGDGYISEVLNIKKDSIKFRVSPFSFFQTNTKGAEILFETAISFLPKIKGTVLDLYCGTGTIGLILKKLGIGSKLIGIEIVKEAIVDAKFNAQTNKINNTEFFDGKVESILDENFDKLDNLDLIVLDPPREGLHKNVINFLTTLGKQKKFCILYISCNPVTMNRDLELLCEADFKLKKLQAVDMFPQTHHIECIGLLNS